MNPFMRKVRAGDNVYIRSPHRLIQGCCSITGDVKRITTRNGEKWAIVKGYVARMGGGYEIEAAFLYEDLGVRIGTPISQISTQPGTKGYGEWVRISKSWGY